MLPGIRSLAAAIHLEIHRVEVILGQYAGMTFRHKNNIFQRIFYILTKRYLYLYFSEFFIH